MPPSDVRGCRFYLQPAPPSKAQQTCDLDLEAQLERGGLCCHSVLGAQRASPSWMLYSFIVQPS